MADFDKCPECGETNYFKTSFGERKFDCGFVGDILGELRVRCGADPETRRRNRGLGTPETEATRFRLALLDAAHGLELIATDMEGGTPSLDHAASCRDEARQLKEFAGHTDVVTDATGTAGSVRETVRRFGALFRNKGS